MDLSDLTKRVNPRKGRTSLVLEHYREIEKARKLLWEWNTIAEALGLGPKKGNALRMAFSYVTKRLEEGKLALPEQRKSETGGRPNKPKRKQDDILDFGGDK